jgi:hypothetical protein
MGISRVQDPLHLKRVPALIGARKMRSRRNRALAEILKSKKSR